MVNEPRKGSRIWKTVRFLLGVVCVLLLWRGTEIVRAYTASLRRFEVDPSQCRAIQPPPWLTLTDLRRIHAATNLIEGPRLSLYTPDLVSRFASAYEA